MTRHDGTYEIRRFRADRPYEVIEEGLTLADARAHCQRDDTHGDDWFDGYADVSPVGQAEAAAGDAAAREWIERVRVLEAGGPRG